MGFEIQIKRRRLSEQPHMISPSISVVIPVFNSESILLELLERLGNVLPQKTDIFEVILVNDGSRDRSWEVVHELADSYPWVRGIDLMRNYGQHNALLAGVREAKYEIIVTMDDDLQHPPEEIPHLLKKIAEGNDVVYGSPSKIRQSIWRKLASFLTKLALQSAMGVDSARQVSAFRAFKNHVSKAFSNYQSGFVSIDVLLTWATCRFAAVEVKHHPRKTGLSNYTFWKLVTHAINMLTGFSTLPLQLASLIGFAFTVFGFFVLAYVIGRYLMLGGSVPGFPFLASIIAIFSGAQLFAIGVIGEYLARMHFRLMGQPPYIVRTCTGLNAFGGKRAEKPD
jgi:undecaprenyl-phosphate 4-deoxy-4-formamido-L-arabinose transferase